MITALWIKVFDIVLVSWVKNTKGGRLLWGQSSRTLPRWPGHQGLGRSLTTWLMIVIINTTHPTAHVVMWSKIYCLVKQFCSTWPSTNFMWSKIAPHQHFCLMDIIRHEMIAVEVNFLFPGSQLLSKGSHFLWADTSWSTPSMSRLWCWCLWRTNFLKIIIRQR